MRVVGSVVGILFLVACGSSGTTNPIPHPGPDGGNVIDGGPAPSDGHVPPPPSDATPPPPPIDATGSPDAHPGSPDAAPTSPDAMPPPPPPPADAGTPIDAGGSPDASVPVPATCGATLRPPMNPLEPQQASLPWHRCGAYGSGSARALRVSADGSRAVVVTDSGDAFVVALPSMTLLRTVTYATNRVSFANLDATGHLLATVDDPHGVVAVWNVDTGAMVRTLARGDWWPSDYAFGDVAFSPDDSRLAAVSVGQIDVWNLTTGAAEPISNNTSVGGGMRVAFAGDSRIAVGRFIYFGNGPYAGWGNVDLMDADTGANQVRLAYQFAIELPSIAVSGDGRLVAIGKPGGPVGLFRTADGAAQPVASIAGAPLTLNHDGSEIAVAESSQLAIRRVSDGGQLAAIPMAAPDVVAVPPDMSRALIGDAPPHVVTSIRFDTATAEMYACGEGGKEVILALSLSTDGTRLVTNDVQDVDRVWDVATGALLNEPPPADRVRMTSFSPDGTQVAVPDDAHSFHTQDVATGTLTRTYRPHETHVDQLDWSRVGTRIASGAYRDPADRWTIPPTVHVWMTDTAALEQDLDAIDSAPPLFSSDEHRLYVGDVGSTIAWCR